MAHSASEHDFLFLFAAVCANDRRPHLSPNDLTSSVPAHIPPYSTIDEDEEMQIEFLLETYSQTIMFITWDQSQSSSSSSACCLALVFCCRRLSSSSVTLFLARTFALISLASKSLVVKLSGVLPRPSNPMIRSAPTPSIKAITHGSTWTPKRVTRNGQLSTLILRIRAS